MTDGLRWGDAYGTTIERIKAQDESKSSLGMEALTWVSHAERLLRGDELCHALAVELGSKDFNARNVPSISTLESCCQGLITVEKETSTVRLIHPTVKEYISSRPDIFSKPHAAMAEICLTYLNSKEVKSLPASTSALSHERPFLGYCSVYWGVHARRELSDHARSLALQLLQECDGHISIKYLFNAECIWFPRDRHGGLMFSGLHLASFFGVVGFVDTLMEMGCYGTDTMDLSGRTPLAWAARGGHEEVVKILLQRGEANPNKSDNEGRTPLSHAACHGHEGVVKVLLGRGEVSPDQPTTWGQKLLSWATQYGHAGVVKMPIRREAVNPDRPDNYGNTPLKEAARRGHKEVVKILLAYQKVDPDKPDTWKTTLLWHAAVGGDEGAAKILLGREEADPDKQDRTGRTLLSEAASKGHEGVVKILLGCQKVNPDKPDIHGQTPLSRAAEYGREEVVKILLERKDVRPNRADYHGETPLGHAVWSCHKEVIALLEAHAQLTPA